MCYFQELFILFIEKKILSHDESFLENDYSEIKEANGDENTVEQVINKLKNIGTN